MAVPQLQWPRGGDLFRHIPVTTTLIILMLVGFVLSNIAPAFVTNYLAFNPGPGRWFNLLTGLFTYHFVIAPNALIGLLLSGYVLWWAGGSLERGWITRTYLLFLAGVSITSAIVWEIGALLFTGQFIMLGSPWLLISAALVSWAWLNPEDKVLLAFLLPMKAKWVGWLTIAILFFSFPPARGPLSFLLGFFALGGIGFAYFFIWYQRKWAWIPRSRQKKRTSRTIRHPSSTFFGSLLRPYREWQRRRRVAHLQRTIRFDD